MQTKKYLVTNNGAGSICVTGRTRIDIPGLCKDLPLTLPEATARQTISRLKQRYPLLKIKEAQTPAPIAEIPPTTGNGADPQKTDTGTGANTQPQAGNTGTNAPISGNAGADDKSDKQDAAKDATNTKKNK